MSFGVSLIGLLAQDLMQLMDMEKLHRLNLNNYVLLDLFFF